MIHLVYCDQKAKVLQKLLDGTKTKLIRGATGRKLPYGRVNVGETLYFVETDATKTIKAKATVSSVYFSPPLTHEESKSIILSEQPYLNLTDEQQKRWIGKKRLSIIEVCNVIKLDESLIYDRKDNMDDWITVEVLDDILLLTSKPYQSVKIHD